MGPRCFFSSAVVLFALYPAISSPIEIPTNFPISGNEPGVQNEEQVWICPEDTAYAVAYYRDLSLGYRQTTMATTLDGGSHWIPVPLDDAFKIFDLQSDPMMTVTSSGDIVVGHLDFADAGDFDSSYISFVISHDCGLTWEGPYTVEDTIGDYFEEKGFVTSDRTGGPDDGNTYVSWVRFSSDAGSRIMFARSTDGGTNWGDTVVVAPPFRSSCSEYPIGGGGVNQPLVGDDGAVYVFWIGAIVDSIDGCSLSTVVRFDKSTDGGASWNGAQDICPVNEGEFIEGGISALSQPTMEADISSGPHRGNLYLQYRDSADTPPYDSDIYFRRSLDTGHTWTPRFRVNDDPAGLDMDQFHNWMVINQEGILVSIWYDQRTDPAHYKFDVFAAYSFDGGETWTANHRVSSVSIDPDLLATEVAATSADSANDPTGNPSIHSVMAGRIAEYIGVSCAEDKVIAVWTDTREGTQDVWGSGWHLFLTDPRLLSPIEGQIVADCDSLWWATGWKESEDMYRLQIATDLSFSEMIEEALLSDNTYRLSTLALASGSYYWRIRNIRAPGGNPAESTAYSSPAMFTIQDSDDDCVPDGTDNCPATQNPEQSDMDADGFGDQCDNCPQAFNPGQEDADQDGVGDACECGCACHADPTCDSVISDVLDVISTVNVAFRGAAPVPDPNGNCPHNSTDVDCSNATDVIDVVKVVNVAFRGLSAAMEYCLPCPAVKGM